MWRKPFRRLPKAEGDKLLLYATAGAATSFALFLDAASIKHRDELQLEKDPSGIRGSSSSNQEKKGTDISNNSTSFHSSLLQLPVLSPPVITHNEAAPSRARSGDLARHRTVKLLAEASTKKSVRDQYAVRWTKPLGEGAFGKVFLAINRETGERVALKRISKRFTNDTGFQREINALLQIREAGGHPHICGLRENYEEGSWYFLALDLIAGGEMFDHLVKMGAYSENDAARLIREIASALAFLHGIGVVHGDLKPENLMLSTAKASDAVVKVVDFGCAQVEDLNIQQPIGNTPAYCPPEVLSMERMHMDPSQDMWALGIILYIMLTGLHPFDLNGTATDEEIQLAIVSGKKPPLRNSPITSHLSPSAIQLIEKLMTWDTDKRLSAEKMLEDPWVQGKTASRSKMVGSDKKLGLFRTFRSRLEAQVFADIVGWSSDPEAKSGVAKRTSLLERSFRTFDKQGKGYITPRDLRKLSGGRSTVPQDPKEDDDSSLSLSGFADLLSENMKNRYFPKGHLIYREGDTGNHMYFINSGTIEVATKDGSISRRGQGDFFGEGALLHPRKIRSATIKCVTPVHAIEISREYFEKYLAHGDGLFMDLLEKDKTRKRNRAKTILRLQNNMKKRLVNQGDYLFRQGEEGEELFILENGDVDVTVEDYTVFKVKPGDMCGEHSLIFGRPRNTSAVCRSETCQVQVMRARDFYGLLESAPTVKESMRDICLRREFQKALVFRTKRPFPTQPKDLRAAFDAVNEDGSGLISLSDVRSMLKRLDPSLEEKDIRDILRTLDLDDSGSVSFQEFQRIFGMEK